MEFGGSEHKGIATQGKPLKGPLEQALLLGPGRGTINQQQIQVTAHAGITPAVTAKHPDIDQGWL
jgi:hypothetical protein